MTTELLEQEAKSKPKKDQNQGALGMQGLLDEEHGYKSVRRGDIIEGVVMRVDRDGLLVDIGSKCEGIVPHYEMRSLGSDGLSQIRVGDGLLVYVVRAREEEGQVLLSLDRARGERGWYLLERYFENGQVFAAEVIGCNKGGLLAEIEGVHGFIPLSHLCQPQEGWDRGRGLSQLVGKQLRVKIIELNRRRNRVILSQRAAARDWRSKEKEQLLAELCPGEIRKGKVTGVRSFGAFVDLGGVEGLVHLSELSWDRTRAPGEIVKEGDEVEVCVMKVDAQSRRIGLSLRRAQPEPWDGIADKYQAGELVKATVTKLVPFGAFARIEDSVEGLIHISELADRHIAHPKEVVKEGDVLTLMILRLEPEQRRLGLSLRRVGRESSYSLGGRDD